MPMTPPFLMNFFPINNFKMAELQPFQHFTEIFFSHIWNSFLQSLEIFLKFLKCSETSLKSFKNTLKLFVFAKIIYNLT